MAAFAIGLVAFTMRGPRIRQSGELRPADGQRCRVTQKPSATRHLRPGTRDVAIAVTAPLLPD